jgi:MFS family permease
MAETNSRMTLVQWLVCAIAAIGFLFDTYELLMTPLVGVPAIAELLQLPPNNPAVTVWTGRLLWLSALSGGIFGLLGGWLIDRFGRKRIMAASIFLYSLSPVAAGLSTTLGAFIFFRCATFIGVCVEFVAAITWLAEMFPDARRKKIVLGSTQAFASVGGLLVTGVNAWVVAHANTLPALPLPEIFNAQATWRYALFTGLAPAVLIAFLLPFVPESQIWRERRQAGTLKRPRFGELFAPELLRVTLVTALLSACAYAAAFGALQLTPLRIAPGLPELADQRKALKPLRDEATQLNAQLSAVMPQFREAEKSISGFAPLAADRAKVRIAQRAARKADDKAQLAKLGARFSELETNMVQLTASAPEARKVLQERERIMKLLGDNRVAQEPLETAVKERGNVMQTFQESGGLVGRILLALLLVTSISHRALLRLFVVPGIVLFPVTYWILYHHSGLAMQWGIFLCGLMVVAQFSYFGEYLPKAFPLHLRGTGGSFATNIGGRMLGTSAAFLTTNVLAPWISTKSTFESVAIAAGLVGTGVFVIAFFATFLLPEPKGQE